MKFASFLFMACILAGFAFGQTASSSATVPITLDHNRIIIDVYLPLPDGTKMRVRAWVDNGNPDLTLTERVAKKLRLDFTGEPQPALGGRERAAQVPDRLLIGGMNVPLTGIKEAHVILGRPAVGAGLSADINLPAMVLRNYDAVVDYPNREFTIAAPGTIHFEGTAAKATVNKENGLIQVPAVIEGENHNLALDVGTPVAFMASSSTSQWLKLHPQWPHMTGAVGPANMWGMEFEPRWELLRLAQVQYGGVPLTGVVAVALPDQFMDWFERRAGMPTSGLIGADALLNYRVGIDYAHSTVYFKQLRKFVSPGIDVVGLILRPEPDERYTVLGVADYEGKPSVPDVKAGDVLLTVDGGRATGATMGQVWSLLEGSPGTVRTLVLERAGQPFTVKATVQRFLSAEPAKPEPEKTQKQ